MYYRLNIINNPKKGSIFFFLPSYHPCSTTPPSLKGKSREENLSRERNEKVGKRMGEGMITNIKILLKKIYVNVILLA